MLFPAAEQISPMNAVVNQFALSQTELPASPQTTKGLQTPGGRGPFAAEDRNQLITQHLPMVRFVARRLCERLPQHIDLEELISAGMVGLVDAAAKFDHTKQVQFKSYAQFRIRGAILDSLRSLDWSPRELRRQGRAVAEAMRHLSARLGRTPGESEVAEELGLDLHTFQRLTIELKGLEIGSLNEERGEEGGEEEADAVPANSCENPLTLCIASQTREQVAAAIASLPERERLVVTLYHYEELSQKEIGIILGVAPSRVSQLRTSALVRLRKALSPCRAAKSAS